MKRFLNVVAWTLALNFLAVLGGAGYLWRTGKLDREKVHAVRELLFPPPTTEGEQAVAVDPATTRPSLRLDEMLAEHAGLPAAEQLQHLRHAFDAKLAQLELAQRSVLDLQRTVRLAQDKLSADRVAFEQQKAALAAKETEATRLAADQGFKDTLALYTGMPAKQAKGAFMQMDDATVILYLQAMEQRAANKIIKEFKTGEELSRITRILEQMRQPTADAGSAAAPTTP